MVWIFQVGKMTERSDDMQLFADCAFVAFDRFARTPESRRCILEIFAALERPGVQRRAGKQTSRLVSGEKINDKIDTAFPISARRLAFRSTILSAPSARTSFDFVTDNIAITFAPLP